jgi:hypothetical protein
MDEKEFPKLVQALYATVGKLEAMFPGRHFTPDGHLVGSLGEALASYYFGVTLRPASAEGHDGDIGSRKVEVKATQGDRVSISSEPEHLLVFKLLSSGSFEVVYNGPGAPVWALFVKRKTPKRAQHQVSVSALKRLMREVAPKDILSPCRPLPFGTN